MFLIVISCHLHQHAFCHPLLLTGHSGAADLSQLFLAAVHVKDHSVSHRSIPSPACKIVINNQHQGKELARNWGWREGSTTHLPSLSYFPFTWNATKGIFKNVLNKWGNAGKRITNPMVVKQLNQNLGGVWGCNVDCGIFKSSPGHFCVAKVETSAPP